VPKAILLLKRLNYSSGTNAVSIQIVLDNSFDVKKNETVNVAVVADVSGSAVTNGKHTVKVHSVTAVGNNISIKQPDTGE